MHDEILVKPATVIQKGWPESQRELSDDFKPYFPYRYTLHIVDGVVAVDGQIMVPSSLKQKFLEKIHEPHVGIIKSKMLAKTLVYWPVYNDDIEAMCQECEQCTEN